jgi:hypothetical protein
VGLLPVGAAGAGAGVWAALSARAEPIGKRGFARGVDGVVRPTGERATTGATFAALGVTCTGFGKPLPEAPAPPRNLASAPGRGSDQEPAVRASAPLARGGRLVEKAAGSGGAMEPEGAGAESNRSDRASWVMGGLSSGSLFTAGADGRGALLNRGVMAAELRASSGLKGMSRAIGSISSVRSSPP